MTPSHPPARPPVTDAPPGRRIAVALLREARILDRVRPSDVIVGKDGKPYADLLALSGQVACDRGQTVRIDEPDGDKIRRMLFYPADILRLADWLRSRGHWLPDDADRA